jgi:hypothetical protein
MVTQIYPELKPDLTSNDFLYRPTLRPKLLICPSTSTTSGSATVFSILPETQTISQYFDREILQLERASRLKDEEEFVNVANQMDWPSRPVENYLLAISLALKVGAHLVARKLAQEGGSRFPGNSEIAKFARILAPVKTIRSDLPPYPQAELDLQWLKEHRQEYHGQWVAIKDGNLVASASTYQDLKTIVGNVKNTRILVIKV